MNRGRRVRRKPKAKAATRIEYPGMAEKSDWVEDQQSEMNS